MSDAIAQAIAAAQAEAQKTPQTQTNTSIAQQGAAQLPATGGAPRTLADLMATAAMNVECYLAVSELGIRLGKDKQLHDEIIVEMCFKDAKPGYTLRVSTGSGVIYLTSWDGISEAKSKQNWAAVIADGKKMDDRSYPSDLVELPVKLAADYKRKEGAPLTEGTTVGMSLSYQNFKKFSGFLTEQYPRYGVDKTFKVKLTAVPKVGGGQDYGVFGYEIVEDAPAAEAKGKSKAA